VQLLSRRSGISRRAQPRGMSRGSRITRVISTARY